MWPISFFPNITTPVYCIFDLGLIHEQSGVICWTLKSFYSLWNTLIKVTTLISLHFIILQLEVNVSSLVSLHLNQWTAEDLRQLERCILVLFSWHIPSCTYLIFLQALLDIIHSKAKTPLPPLDYFIQKAEVCLQAVSSFVLRVSGIPLCYMFF